MSDYLSVFTSPQGEIETLRAYQTVLDKWSAPFSELDVPTRFGQTHVIVSGPPNAPPIVLLHAYFATAMSWYRNVGTLSQQYRIYAVDVMGEANKSRPTRVITSPDDCLSWFTELVDRLGLGEFFLVGNSFGGFTAAYYAMHLRERIRKLVLIGPAATFHGMAPFYWHMFAPKAVYLFLPWLPGQKRLVRHSIEWMRAGLPADPAWEELFRLVLMHGTTRVQVFPKTYTPAELAQIKAPTLLLLGDREKIYPPSSASEQAKRLMPNLQTQIIPQAHHITALAQPERVNASLMQFFRDAKREPLARSAVSQPPAVLEPQTQLPGRS